jgi:cytochrome c oxidase cbb3-type subunit 3
MNDFMSDPWNWFITLPTLIGIAGCAWLLVAMGKRRVKQGQTGSAKSTGHIWDETLSELNNPLPRWWVALFAISILFSLGYLLIFPGLGNNSGLLGWSSNASHQTEIDQANQELTPLYSRYENAPIATLQSDPKAMGIAERLFLNNCAQCHGSDGRGSQGFPNLADADWLYGGQPERVIATITQGRNGVMPSMVAAVGSEKEVADLIEYVLSLSGKARDMAAANRGQPKFALCIACHGAEGKGNTELGAPNLTDPIWLYGGSRQTIRATLEQGRSGVMPAHQAKLSTSQIRLLAAYALALSNSP